MIEQDGAVRLTPGVRVRVRDDATGFVESADGVRRLSGTGLRVLADRVLPRLDVPARPAELAADLADVLPRDTALSLLDGLLDQGIIEPATIEAAKNAQVTTVEVHGPTDLTADLFSVLRRMPRIGATRAGDLVGDPDLVVVATASIFDPGAGRVNEQCVREGRACLHYGVVRDGAAFVGPLPSPDRTSAPCYECLRTRIFANSVHGPTWRAYADFLAEAGLSALPQRTAPWNAARLAGAVARRIAGWPERAAADLLWLDENGEESSRRLLPVPTCPVCAAQQQQHPAPVSPMTAAVDDLVGVVHSVNVRRADGGPRIYLAGSTTSDLSLVRPGLGVIRNGGAGFAKRDALNATIGESLERYAAGVSRPGGLRLASWTELTGSGEPAVHPTEFGLFSDAQYEEPGFPFPRFAEDTRVRWVRATRWTDGDTVWVPASQVFLYYRRARDETPVAPSISTGLAAGPSRREAVLGGLHEILERDALAISWLHRLPPRPVPEDVVAGSTRVRYHLANATSWRVSFYDLSLDFAPTVVVAVMDGRGGPDPVLSFGSACRATPERAVEKAFLEAAQGLTYVRRLVKDYGDFDPGPDFGNVDEFNKHAILYTLRPELRRRAGYLVHPDEPPVCARPARTPPPGTDLDATVAELAAAGHDTYVVDLSTTDTRHVGVDVVRVLVPGLQHLSGAHRFRLLGNPRLRGAVRALGFDSEPDNPFPHPLP
ncbi:TOMM precursor leader peptide-binding protein [Actinomadura syzygii]|uniref:TOMM leader peptide-binding protein n=1 Tax=Actinomadura syzygii TaxID=1427538 RepID=A0A5D0U9K7_9ACTN|nr:TOMM precursor leader peptide-binding protein [Actinomadura syzygii]TYC15038.1 TOMM precursor leader peptide-binding protein [Actinomadura syzygii]